MTYDRRCKAFRQPCSMGHGSDKSGNVITIVITVVILIIDNNTFFLSWEKAVQN